LHFGSPETLYIGSLVPNLQIFTMANKFDSASATGKIFQTNFAPVSSLDIFEGDSLQICVTDEVKFDQRSNFQFNDNSEIIVHIEPSMTLYTAPDLTLNCELELTVEENGQNVGIKDSDVNICPTTMPISTLFSDITCKLGNQIVTSKSNLYPYIGYLFQTHLTENDEYPLLEGQSLAYRFKSLNKPDDSDDKQSYVRSVFSEKKKVLISGKIYLPIFLQQKALLNNVGITLIFSQTSSEFRVLDMKTGRKAKLSIKDLWVSGRRMQLNDRLLITMLDTLKEQNAIYPIQRWMVDESNVPLGNQHFSKTLTLVTSQVPDYVFLMCVETDAVRGNYKKSPFKSNILQLESAQIVLENKAFPPTPFKPNSANGILRAFSEYKHCIKNITGHHNWVDIDAYQKDYGILAFKLSRSETEDANIGSLPRGGVATLNLIFNSQTTTSQTIILFYCYRNKITFNSVMIPSTDY